MTYDFESILNSVVNDTSNTNHTPDELSHLRKELLGYKPIKGRLRVIREDLYTSFKSASKADKKTIRQSILDLRDLEDKVASMIDEAIVSAKKRAKDKKESAMMNAALSAEQNL